VPRRDGEGRVAAHANRESQREAVLRLMTPLLTALLSSLSTALTSAEILFGLSPVIAWRAFFINVLIFDLVS
jgi:hypothetical protein